MPSWTFSRWQDDVVKITVSLVDPFFFQHRRSIPSLFQPLWTSPPSCLHVVSCNPLVPPCKVSMSHESKGPPGSLAEELRNSYLWCQRMRPFSFENPCLSLSDSLLSVSLFARMMGSEFQPPSRAHQGRDQWGRCLDSFAPNLIKYRVQKRFFIIIL